MMKKVFLICLLALTTMCVFGQKKAKTQQFDPKTMMKTSTDSLSYAFGRNMTNGMSEYLKNMKVLTDSATITAEYGAKIAEATDKDKAKLEKELETKLATIKDINNKSLDEFIKGLNQAVFSGEVAFNAGIGVGGQLVSMTERFEAEAYDNQKLNMSAFVNAVNSSLRGEDSALENPEEYFQQAATELQQATEIKKAEELKATYGERITAEARFLADNKTKDGITTLPSGLQYKVNVAGTGAIPTSSDRVTVHYRGRLLDGTEFDSSYSRNEPTTFGVTQVIKGWTEALLLMPAGSNWTIYVPQDLAYGERDQGVIKPFSTLIFDIELIEIAE